MARVAPPLHATKTQIALQELREDIRSGTLAAGERLRVDEVAAELGMSPTPVREALRLLQADGLVEFRPHQGIVVASLSATQTAEIYHLRALLEPDAVMLAVPRMSEHQLAELRRLHEKVVKAVHSGRGSAVSDTNAAWHWALYRNCGSDHLVAFIQRLWDAFPWRTIWAITGRAEQSLREHQEVMDAIDAGDAELAAERMRTHVLSGVETLINRLERGEKMPRGATDGD